MSILVKLSYVNNIRAWGEWMLAVGIASPSAAQTFKITRKFFENAFRRWSRRASESHRIIFRVPAN
jgi:hypothetical protein